MGHQYIFSLWALEVEDRGTSVYWLCGLFSVRLVGHQFVFFVGS